MYPQFVREEVLKMLAAGIKGVQVSQITGVSTTTVSAWQKEEGLMKRARVTEVLEYEKRIKEFQASQKQLQESEKKLQEEVLRLRLENDFLKKTCPNIF